MKGYTFVYGLGYFGGNISPAYEEGIYLNKEKAWEHFKELTKQAIVDNPDEVFYENGYGEDYYPDDNKELKEAEQKEDWDLFNKLMKKHILTDLDDICEEIYNYEEPPCDFYQLVEVNIIE